jgi:hypothetical protein
MITWLRLWLACRLWPRGGSVGACANRSWRTTTVGPLEYRLLVRDTSRPDGYERTELLTMLREVRKHEGLTGWRVPEVRDG